MRAGVSLSKLSAVVVLAVVLGACGGGDGGASDSSSSSGSVGGLGTVSGTVSSSLGGVFPGVTVKVTPADAAALSSATTSSAGAYSVAAVPVGSGTVTLSGLPASCAVPSAANYTLNSAATTFTVNITVACVADLNIAEIVGGDSPYIAVVTDAHGYEKIGLVGTKDTAGVPVTLDEAVYISASGDVGRLAIGPDGLPTSFSDAVGNTVTYTNYTDTSVEVRVFDPAGVLIVGPSVVAVTNGLVTKIRNAAGGLSQGAPSSKSRALNITPALLGISTRDWINTSVTAVGFGLQLAGCAAIAAATPATGGLALVAAAYACGSAAVQFAEALNIQTPSFVKHATLSVDVLSTLSGYAECVSAFLSMGNPWLCLEPVIGALVLAPITNLDFGAPKKPTELRVTLATASGVSLYWTGSSDDIAVTGYRVYRNGSFYKNVGMSYFRDTTVTRGANYCYEVAAYDAAGKFSERSNEACVTVPDAYAVNVQVSGLAGSGLVLRNNSASTLIVTANGSFPFATALSSGSAYNVTVSTQPTNPSQFCTPTNGVGTVGSSNITYVTVVCSAVSSLPLTLLSSNPTNGATNVVRTIAPALTFSTALNASTVTASNVTLQSAAGPQAITVSTTSNTLTVTPIRKLLPMTTYTLTVGTGVRGSNGQQLASAVTTNFKTRDGAWQGAALIETNNAGDAAFPQIAIDANGNALAVWEQFDGTRSSIWSNRYTAGAGWGAPMLIETSNASDAYGPQVVIDVNGNALAVWSQFDNLSWNVWSNRYTAGIGWGAAALIGTNAGPHRLAIDSSGNALAVWPRSNGSRYNIFASRYTVGSGWAPVASIPTNALGVGPPELAFDGSGNALAVWYQYDGFFSNIWSSRYVAGSGWSTATLIETDNVADAGAPQVAVDTSGNVLAVWYQSDGARNNIWSNRYTVGGGWGTPTLIETDNAGGANGPQISFDASGNALAVWYQSDGTRNNIWSNRYTTGGGWGTPTLIETDNTGDASEPKVAFDTSGNGLVVWTQHDGSRLSIWSNRYTAGGGWGTATLIETDNLGNVARPQIAIDASGNALAVWHQSDGTRNNVYAERFE